MTVASSIQRLVLTTPPRTAPTRRDYETDDFLSRPLSTLKLHCDGYSHHQTPDFPLLRPGQIGSDWIRISHVSLKRSFITFALGLLIPRAPPSSTLVHPHRLGLFWLCIGFGALDYRIVGVFAPFYRMVFGFAPGLGWATWGRGALWLVAYYQIGTDCG